MKRKIAAVIAAVALIGLGVAVAVGGAGEDPLVAKSYMEDTYPAALVQALEKRASEGTKGTYSQSIAKLDKAGEADVKAADGEGNMSVNLDYTVIKDSDRLFSIRFDQLLVMASGTQLVKIYHIDKQTGEMINLAGLFREGTDFITPISDNIKKQMKEQMEADEMITYWLDSETPEWDFQSVREDSTFYVNEKGNLVIVFERVRGSSRYMGSVEFEIPDEVTRDLVQEGFLGN